MKTLTTEKQRESLKELIQTELLKRGFTAPIVEFEETDATRGGNYISFCTEKFQTVPVMFKEVQVSQFNSSLKQENKTSDDGKEDYIVTSFWLTIHVGYKHFDGGTNGCQLFEISGKFYDDDSHLYNFQIR